MLDSELVSPGDAAWIESFDFGKCFIAKAHRLPHKGMQINPLQKQHTQSRLGLLLVYW